MQINDPETLAAVTAAFARYEAALISNDVAVLDELFWNSPHTIRYGVNENLYGIDAIRAFRDARPATGLARTLDRTVITTYGTDFATAATLFHRTPGKLGRQMQTWVRMPADPDANPNANPIAAWRVVAATVSVIEP